MKTLSTFLSVILIAAISFTGLSSISKENQYTSVRKYNKPGPIIVSLPLDGQDQPTSKRVATTVPRDGAVSTLAQMIKDQTIQAAAEKAAKSAPITQDQANRITTEAIAQAAKNKTTQASAAQQAQDQAIARRTQATKAAAQVAAQKAQAAQALSDQAAQIAAQQQAAAQANTLRVNTRTMAS